MTYGPANRMTGGGSDCDLLIVARGSRDQDLRRVCITSLESVLHSILSHRLYLRWVEKMSAPVSGYTKTTGYEHTQYSYSVNT